MANQEYGNWLNNLQSYVSPELAATGGEASATAAKAPVYTNTANSIANLGTNTTNSIANQNTQAANAAMQGSGNLWNFGLNVAKLGTSLLGGGGGGGGGSSGLGSLFMGGGSPSGL